MDYKKISGIAIIVIFIAALGYGGYQAVTSQTKDVKVEAKDSAKVKKAPKKEVPSPENVKDDKDMVPLKDFDYNTASEKKDYPNLADHPDAFIDVDIATQRMYIKEGKTILYEMYASTGKKDATPKGTYHVQGERGEFFYTQPLKLGAYYWVSFLNHGEYLFHTTPTDEQGNYVESIAKTLGREPSSHGCIHLSVPDCKWVYENVPYGMKVVIHGDFKA